MTVGSLWPSLLWCCLSLYITGRNDSLVKMLSSLFNLETNKVNFQCGFQCTRESTYSVLVYQWKRSHETFQEISVRGQLQRWCKLLPVWIISLSTAEVLGIMGTQGEQPKHHIIVWLLRITIIYDSNVRTVVITLKIEIKLISFCSFCPPSWI